jgi:hypothetical protein
MANKTNRYAKIIQAIFAKKHKPGDVEVVFERTDLTRAAGKLGIALPKNLGDVLYSFRYRQTLPASIAKTAPTDKAWIIRPAGRARYKFVLAGIGQTEIVPSPMLAETKIPDATPGLVRQYALDDEQALLSMLRYNRLIDVFTGLTCYSLQNHLRTTVPAWVKSRLTSFMWVLIDAARITSFQFRPNARGIESVSCRLSKTCWLARRNTPASCAVPLQRS